jgi:acetyl-CoA carboxylase/biotin carboxylase 1
VHFADLHDTPGRMKAKGVIRRQVQWANSRTFFYWRLRRRLHEFDVVNRIVAAGHALSTLPSRSTLIDATKQFVVSQCISDTLWDDDRALVAWFDDHEKDISSFVQSEVSRLRHGTHHRGHQDLLKAILAMPAEDRERLLAEVTAAAATN